VVFIGDTIHHGKKVCLANDDAMYTTYEESLVRAIDASYSTYALPEDSYRKVIAICGILDHCTKSPTANGHIITAFCMTVMHKGLGPMKVESSPLPLNTSSSRESMGCTLGIIT
jgi:hypothetical protein